VRIEGAFEGDINLRGLLVVGESGRVTCEHLKAGVVIVAGAVRGDITAEKVEIRASGRVWGNVMTAAFATEEGAFLRGQIRMEEHLPSDEAEPGTEPEETPAKEEAQTNESIEE
jgi:cytoskeletal protein CcmA (bactofilin family)